MKKNLKIYNTVFTESFCIKDDQLLDLKYQDIIEWDSIGHMGLMNALEEAFNIEMEIDDIIDFSSYKKGKDIVAKYNISFSE